MGLSGIIEKHFITKNTNSVFDLSNLKSNSDGIKKETVSTKSSQYMNKAIDNLVPLLISMFILCAILISGKKSDSPVFCQSYLRNKRLYLNTRVLQAYVCMNGCNGSCKIVNIQNKQQKMMYFRASSHVANIFNESGFYSQTEYIPNHSRLTIYLTILFSKLFTPIIFLSNDHIKILPVPSCYVLLLDIYFCLLNVL